MTDDRLWEEIEHLQRSRDIWIKCAEERGDQIMRYIALLGIAETREKSAQAECDKLQKRGKELKEVVQICVDSQAWDGNDPDEDRWTKFYAKARAALEDKP